ncbi:MAG: entry exclusion lipoprotein TrbK [Nitrosomonas sp.]|nr:entry exclusion lipoprotein TrbK [Nitrosomonas sp.]MBX3641239.1 entry exclusion lipoprotein TrbK [Nitrosomonas sp.]MCW5608584.1 entry exclusion lipoprotein TrbK [Nitrosomonas sp.]MCW5619092.1 entry exclusion lipoprotein TrbK [Nitrosomonas sp.]
MKFKVSVVCIIGLSIALVGCDSVPEANTVNCSGRGMEQSLTAFKNDEAARQAFIDKCNALVN